MKKLLNCLVLIALFGSGGCSEDKASPRREFSPFAGYWANSSIAEYRKLRQEDHLARATNNSAENKATTWICARLQLSALKKNYLALPAYKIGVMGHVYEYRIGAARLPHQPVWQTSKTGLVSKSTLTEFGGPDAKIMAQEMKMIDPNTIANVYTVKKADKDPEQVEEVMIRTSEQELIEIGTAMESCK